VANSTLPVPFISDPIEQQYAGNIEVLQEQLILLSLPVVEQPSLQNSKPAFTMPEPKSVDNIKQPIINSEISLQSYSNLQASEGGSHDRKEDMQRFLDLQSKQQQEVFVFSLIDPFSNYLKFLSSLHVRAILSIEGWLSCSFEIHLCILWFLAFSFSKLRDAPISKILVWLHWKHDFT